MKINTIVMFNEQGKRKFPKAGERLFLYIGDVENNPQYAVVKGFRGKYIIGEEMFIEDKDDLRALTAEETRLAMIESPSHR